MYHLLIWSPANVKGANKDAKIYVGRSTTLHNLLFCTHTLCMNYVTNTFLLVSSSVRSKDSKQLFCFVQGQGQKREQKHTTKNFVEFHNHSPLLIMSSVLISIEKIHQTLKTAWPHFKHLKVRQKYSAAHLIFISFLGVWNMVKHGLSCLI